MCSLGAPRVGPTDGPRPVLEGVLVPPNHFSRKNQGTVDSAKTVLDGQTDLVTILHHVQLAMPPGGEPAARAFYEGLLAITEVPKPATLAARGGCWFEDGPLRVHLGVEADFRPATKAHPALLVDDLHDLLTRLAAGGHPSQPGDGADGLDQCYVDDPFGNRIELIGILPQPARGSSA